MVRRNHFEYNLRLYLNVNGKRVLGKGGAQILEAIEDSGSISAAAEALGMSYKFVWDYLVRMRRILRSPVVVTHRGGGRGTEKGGGGATLTPFARNILQEFHSTETTLKKLLKNRRIAIRKQ